MSWLDSCNLGRAAAEKATALDPGLAEARGLRAEIAFMADEPADVLDREVRKALELNPNLAQAHTILAALAGSLGIAEAYVAETEAAYRLDPLSPQTSRSLGNAYFFSGRFDEALAHWRKTMEQAPIDALRGMTDYYVLKGDFEAAERMVKELEGLAPSSDFALLCRGWLSAVTGDRSTAMKMIEKLQETSREGYARQSSVGFIYYALGDLNGSSRSFFPPRKRIQCRLAGSACPRYLRERGETRDSVELMSTYGRPVQAPK